MYHCQGSAQHKDLLPRILRRPVRITCSAAQERQVMELPVASIRRPLARTRSNDQRKVEELMASIQEIGLQVPIDVLEVEGVYYG